MVDLSLSGPGYYLNEQQEGIFSPNSNRIVRKPGRYYDVDFIDVTYDRLRNPTFRQEERAWIGLIPYHPYWSGVFYGHLKDASTEVVMSKKSSDLPGYWQLPNYKKEIWLRLDDILTHMLSTLWSSYKEDHPKVRLRPPYAVSELRGFLKPWSNYERCIKAIERARTWFIVRGTYVRWLLLDNPLSDDRLAKSMKFPVSYLQEFRDQEMFHSVKAERVGYFLDSSNPVELYNGVRWCWNTGTACFFVYTELLEHMSLPNKPTREMRASAFTHYQNPLAKMISLPTVDGISDVTIPYAVLVELDRRGERQIKDRRALPYSDKFVLKPEMLNRYTTVNLWSFDTEKETYVYRNARGNELNFLLYHARKGATFWNKHENTIDILLQETLDANAVHALAAYDRMDEMDYDGPEADTGVPDDAVHFNDMINAVEDRIASVTVTDPSYPSLSTNSLAEAVSHQVPSAFIYGDEDQLHTIFKMRFGYVEVDSLSPRAIPLSQTSISNQFENLLIKWGFDKTIRSSRFAAQFALLETFSHLDSCKERELLSELANVRHGCLDLAPNSGRAFIKSGIKDKFRMLEMDPRSHSLDPQSTCYDVRGLYTLKRIHINCDDTDTTKIHLFATSSVDALHLYRHLVSLELPFTSLNVCKFFLEHGMKFHAAKKELYFTFTKKRWILGSNPSHSIELLTNNQPEASRSFTLADYHKADARSKALLQSKLGRLAAMRGGIVSRLARAAITVDPDLVLCGPNNSDRDHFYEKETQLIIAESGLIRFWDEVLSKDMLYVICGSYNVTDAAGKSYTVSWWPLPLIWEKTSAKNLGFWASSDESWYQKRLLEIHSGKAQPLSTGRWEIELKAHGRQRELRGLSKISDAVMSDLTKTTDYLNTSAYVHLNS